MKLTIWFKEIDGSFAYNNRMVFPEVTIFRLDNDLLRWETSFGLNCGTLVKKVRFYLLEEECQKPQQPTITQTKQVNPLYFSGTVPV